MLEDKEEVSVDGGVRIPSVGEVEATEACRSAYFGFCFSVV